MRLALSHLPRLPRLAVPQVWPFIMETPRDDHALLLAINRLVPRWLKEQVRQDVCQDIVVEVISGAELTTELVRDVLKRGWKLYGFRWDELSLDAWCYEGSGRGNRWADVLSFENPIQRFRPKVEPTVSRRSVDQIKDDTYMSPLDQAFEEFWAIYPKRIAKLAALKAYEKARTVATVEEIHAGLQGYLANLPEEMRYVAHAASWLNAGRWMDDYTPPVAKKNLTPARQPYIRLADRGN